MRNLPTPPTSRKWHVANLLKKKGDVGRFERAKHAQNAPLPELSRRYHVALSVTLAFVMLSLAWIGVNAAARTIERQTQTQSPTPDAQREREAEPAAPAISFIDSPSATCSRPVAGTNACTIEWNYLSVDAGSNYMITMTVSIDGKIRANTQGFFQNSMYIPGDMLAQGFRVDCGLPGASGNPALGQAYSYTLRARDSAGLSAANYGSVTCPSDIVLLAQLHLTGPAVGTVNTGYSFDAAVLPITTTLPVTYTWSVTDYPSQVVVGGLADSKNFTWASEGTKTITVEARNRSNMVSQSVTILIEPRKIYLPLIQR